MAIYTFKNPNGTTFKLEQASEKEAKFFASGAGLGIEEIPNFVPTPKSEINTAILANTGKVGASTPSSAITAEQLKTQQAINLPTYQAPTITPVTPLPEYKAPEKTATTEPDWFSKYMTDLKTVTPVNTVDIYNNAYSNSGLDTLTSDLTAKKTATTEAQKNLDLLQAKLTGITSEATAAQQTLESQAGTGKDVTGTFLGRQQQEISRQSAIKSLPVQAEVLAVQAKVSSAQGDVTTAQNAIALAQDKLNTAFKVQSDYAQSVYDYNKELRTTLYDYATKKEQQQLDAQDKADEQAFELYKNELTNNQALAKTALENGQADIAAKITALDPSSSTYPTDLSNLTSQIKVEPDVTVKDLPDGSIVAIDKKGNIVKTIVGITGGGTIANKEYSGILNTILGSGKFTKDQKATITNAINNGEDPFTVIKNQAKSIAGQTEATKITGFEVAKNQLDDISSLLNKYYDNGGSTGIFQGNYEKVINNLGNVIDPKLVDLSTQIAAALQIYRNAVSGTAYSEQEGKDIASIFPGINKSEGLNKAILEGRKKAFDSTIDGSYRSILGSSYDSMKKLEKSLPKTETDLTKLDNNSFLNANPSGTQSITEATGESFFNMFPNLGITK